MSTALLGTPERPLRVAVIGAGPSGFYAAAALLGSDRVVEVDLFDRLPAPYGLVRGGVAPDHQKIKTVVRAYQKTARMPGFRFFGNVRVGQDVPLEVLRQHYDQLCFAVGCECSRTLGIEGEELHGSVAASDFVGWYNGHPDWCDACYDLDHVERVAVIGVGNVAVDVARILTKDPEVLARTDIADHALEVLRRSAVREVILLGRRGPVQAAFTPAELKELTELEGVDFIVPEESIHLDPLSRASLERAHKNTRRNVEILEEVHDRGTTGAPRRIVLKLYQSPVAIRSQRGPDGVARVAGLEVERTELVGTSPDALRARGTGEREVLDVQMVFRAVGYRGVPLEGLPFDPRWGVIPNEAGRVMDGDSPVADTYVVGWAKRGPSGVIGTNRADANETVAHMLADAQGRHGLVDEAHTAEGARRAIEALVPEVVGWGEWERIDAEEVARGEAEGRVRRKFIRVEDMLDLLRTGAGM